MRVLVTAGGTIEQIDEVRGITNFSTGRLGSLIAACYSEVPGVEVTYLCGRGAQRPSQSATLEIIEIGSTQELLATMTSCLQQATYDIVVHSMAVSDYYLVGSSGEEALVNQLLTIDQMATEPLKKALDQTFLLANQEAKKISSNIDTLYLQLKQTPKVISVIKELQPAAVLVGFKLLVDVPSDELVDVAHKLMAKNRCDFVLANDKSQINGDDHRGYLLNSTGKYTTYETKQAIAKGIVEQTMRGSSI